VTTSGGCAAHLSSVIGRDRVVELSEYLQNRVTGQVRIGDRQARVALQDSCHLRNGLDVWREPRALLSTVAEYVELPSAARCCGAAGTYALVRPRDSRRVLDPKIDEIEAAGSTTWWPSIPAACVSSARDYAAGNQPSERCTSPISCAWQPTNEPPTMMTSSVRGPCTPSTRSNSMSTSRTVR